MYNQPLKIRMVFVFSLLLAVAGALAEALRCNTCNREIRGRHLKVGADTYCNRQCHAQSLPVCDACGTRLSGQFVRAGDKVYCGEACHRRTLPSCAICSRRITTTHQVLDGRHFCSQTCLEKYLPACDHCRAPLYRSVGFGDHRLCPDCAELPRCWSCKLPKPRTSTLDDGRRFCSDCLQHAVTTLQQAQPLYMLARHEVFRVTGYRSPSLPALRIVGQNQLRQSAPDHADLDAVQWGVYKRNVTLTTTSGLFAKPRREITGIDEEIHILAGLSRNEFIVTASHELTHDLLAEQFPEIAARAPNWVEEGLCQYVAAAVCLLNGFYPELKVIENAPDREYGDGYRFFKSRFGDANWSRAVQWMRIVEIDKLPAYPPE